MTIRWSQRRAVGVMSADGCATLHPLIASRDMSAKGWHQALEFGDGEPLVRLLEDASPEELTSEITRRLARKTTEDEFYLAAGRAAVRSTRYRGAGIGQGPARALHAAGPPRARFPPADRSAALSARGGCETRPHGDPRSRLRTRAALRVSPRSPRAAGRRFAIAYLDAVRYGDTDVADHIFAWLFKNLPPEEMSRPSLDRGAPWRLPGELQAGRRDRGLPPPAGDRLAARRRPASRGRPASGASPGRGESRSKMSAIGSQSAEMLGAGPPPATRRTRQGRGQAGERLARLRIGVGLRRERGALRSGRPGGLRGLDARGLLGGRVAGRGDPLPRGERLGRACRAGRADGRRESTGCGA